MDFSDVTGVTPKVLDKCLDLFSQSEAENDPIPQSEGAISTPAKYASHPDIRFFSAVKTKNHFAYHASKRAQPIEGTVGTKVSKTASNFDPFSRTLLLKRIRSYTALNWSIPYFKPNDRQLTELFCSAYGWKCEASAPLNNQMNSLRCTGCNRQLILTFNALDQQPPFAPSFFDVDDIQELNVRLKDSYLEQIKSKAHASSCPWRLFPCPLDGTYYLTPHLDTTNEKLISGYLSLLCKLYGNLAIAKHYENTFMALAPQQVLSGLADFIRISNSWLLSRYFKDSKENFGPLLEKTFPPWAYVLSAMGWDLHVQTFETTAVPLLICTMCNQRVFLESPKNSNGASNLLQTAGTISDDISEDSDCDLEENGLACHKPWCLLVSQFGEAPFFTYFHEMLIRSEANLGPGGQYQHTIDEFSERNEDTDVVTRKRSGDVIANLERFSKLRRLYFADSDS